MNRVEAQLARRIDHLRRLVGTALSFALFGLGGVFLSLLVFMPMNLIVADRNRRRFIAQLVVHHSFRLFVRTLIALGVIDLEVIDGAELQRDQGRLIISNHPSLIDVVLIISLVRQMQCVVKHQNWRNPFIRGVLAATGYVRNDDDPARLVDACVQALRAGNNLLIFPEGSRTVPGRPRRLQRGFANICIAAEAPLRLVTVTCSPQTLTKGEKWHQIPPARPLFRLAVHEVIDVKPLLQDCRPSIAVRRLTRHVNERLTEVLADARA